MPTSTKILKLDTSTRHEPRDPRPAFHQTVSPFGDIVYSGTIRKTSVYFRTSKPLPDFMVRNLLNWRMDRIHRNRA